MTDVAAPTIEQSVDLAKRAFALKKYEDAVDHYATALEQAVAKYGSEDAPELADLYLSYGQALLENAISQSDVLGKDGGKEEQEPEETIDTVKAGKLFSFSGDAEEETTVDLFAQAAKEVAAADAAANEGEEDDEDSDGEAEPEDDFNAAWEVLDLARAIYEKRQEEGGAVQLALADTFIALGDVSLETEKFDQAITDYFEGLRLKKELLSISSRHIAEVHYKLSMVLDLTSGRLSDAIMHAELALESVEARLAELQSHLASGPAEPSSEPDTKGKGKSKSTTASEIAGWSKTQVESEIKELEGLKEEMGLKIVELKTSPNEIHTSSAPELAQKALEQELNGTTGAPAAPTTQVNDLSGMVKKKKPAAAAAPAAGSSTTSKRKAEDDTATTPPEKKSRLEDSNTST